MKSLTQYQQEELEYLKTQQEIFSKKHPDIASRLGLGSPDSDPNVEKILLSTAFLTAKIQKNLDEEYENFIHSFIESTFPCISKPIPAHILLQFHPYPTLNKMICLEKGTEMIAEQKEVSFPFQTGENYPVIPIKISNVRLSSQHTAVQKNILCLELEKCSEKTVFSMEEKYEVRASIQMDYSQACLLYFALLHENPEFSIALDEELAHNLNEKIAIHPIILAQDSSAEELLLNFYHFPQLFLRFQFELDPHFLKTHSKIYLWKECPDSLLSLSKYLHPQCIQLNCIPCTNLFTRSCDPIYLRNHQHAYPLLALDKNTSEVMEIKQVTIRKQTSKELLPVEEFLHFSANLAPKVYWNHLRLEKNKIILEDPHHLIDMQVPHSMYIELSCTSGTSSNQLRNKLDITHWKISKNNENIFSEITAACFPSLFHSALLETQALSLISYLLQSSKTSLFSSENPLEIFKKYLSILDQSKNAHWEMLRSNLQSMKCNTSSILAGNTFVSGIEIIFTWSKQLAHIKPELFLFEEVLRTTINRLKPLNTILKVRFLHE